MNGKELYQHASHCKPTPRPPVWLMRQAGRYMADYQAIRKKHDFLTMIHTPELAAEVTLQPIHKFGMDAAILFSDILVTAEALGLPLSFEDGVGPLFHPPIQTETDLEQLDVKGAAEKLDYVIQAITLLRPELDTMGKALLGFAGAPLTVASYMVKQKGQPSLKNIQSCLSENPTLFHKIMDILTTVTIQYLNAQIAAGVDGIQIFESWATAFSFDDYKAHAFPYLKKIVDSLHNPNKIPITLFCRNTDTYLPLLLETNATTISVDWNSSIQDIATTVPPTIALQGNLNPDILLTTPATVQQKTNELLEGMQGRPGHIVNLGHGITPKSKEENVAALVDTVKAWTARN